MTKLDNSRVKLPPVRLTLETEPLSTLEQELKKTDKAAVKAAKAQAALARASTAVTKAVTNAALAFDELHVAGKDRTQEKSASGGKSGGKGRAAGAKKEADDTRGVWERCRDALLEIFELLRLRLGELTALFEPSVRAWGAAFDALRAPVESAVGQIAESLQGLWDGALRPLCGYLLETFVPGIVNAFSETVAPVFADVGALLASVLGEGFSAACTAAQDAVNVLLLPALETVREIFVGLCEGITAAWAEYGPPLLESAADFFTTLGTLWDTLYTELLAPGLESLAGLLDGLWEQHLAPLWQSFTEMVAELGLLLAMVWNEFLAPLLQKLTEIFAPMLAAVFDGACGAVRGLLTAAGTVARHVIEALRGLIDFLAGVFTGDWGRAWDGIRRIVENVWEGITGIVRGAVNLVIDCVNALIRGAAAGVNAVIGALNAIHVKVPNWVPEFGGRQFGINLPTVTAPQVPYLAKGAVIPPNAEFLAVLGDQKNGRNLEAPEALLRQIVREEGGGTARFEAEQPIELLLDGEVFYRAMTRIGANRGARIGGAFAEAR